MSDDLAFESLLRISERIRRREIASVTVTEAMLDRIQRHDGRLRSYTTVLKERALARARQADAEIRKDIWRGPLHGVPIAVKDLYNTTFAPTGAGTKIHERHVPSENATVVERLERGGAILLGKLTMTEGAYTSHHPANPAPLNPWGEDRWVGSSSTGSGVATAAGLCYGSLGSDTGGSIRFPSATCGLTGIKPTWGRVSRHGVFALAASLDHLGPMTRSAGDAAAMLAVVAGADPKDPTTLQASVPDYRAALGQNIQGLRIGIDRSYVTEGVDPQVAEALGDVEKALSELGARIVPIRFPSIEKLVRGWIPFCSVETALAHADTYPERADAYGPELKQLIEQGRNLHGLELGAIYHERLAFSGALSAIFEQVDLLLIPTMPVLVPTLAKMGEYGQDPDVLLGILRFTAPFDFSGSPTITLPSGIDDQGMPLSVQLVGPHLSELLLCQAGHAYQSVTDWHTRRPPALLHGSPSPN